MNKEYPVKKIIRILAGIILLFLFTANAQDKDNLQIFNELADSSVTQAVSFIPDSVKNVKLELNTGIFAVFNSAIISGLSKKGYKLVSDDHAFKIQYIIKEAVTSYGDIFRDGLLGDYFVSRKIVLTGSYNFSGRTIHTKDFRYSFQDTVNVDSISVLEDSAYPFTRAKLPAEPFFSGILEPVIAIGTAALAVILFFTIRSK